MGVLILGLLLFLGAHSVRIVADDWRNAQVARLGPQRWKGLYTLVSLLGLGLVVWGFGLAREMPVALWSPPQWGRHLASLLTLPAFVLLTAAYVPRNRIRRAVGHPMVLGTALWALAHLLSNGSAAELLLFGGFFVWAAFDFRSARRRDREAGTVRPAGSLAGDAATLGVGVLAWAAFALYLHGWLFGVRPFG